MGSYHNWQIVELVILLSKFSFLNNTNCLLNRIFNSEKTSEASFAENVMYMGRNFSIGEDLKEVWLGLKPFDSDHV